MTNRRRDNNIDYTCDEIPGLLRAIPDNITVVDIDAEGMEIVDAHPNNDWSYFEAGRRANNMTYVHANKVGNFRIKGQLPMSNLAPGRTYKGAFELELTDKASGWQGPFVISLTVPGSTRPIQSRSYTYNRFGMFVLNSNTFQLAAPQGNRSLSFSLSHDGPCIRKGLIIQRFVIERA